MVFTDTEAQKMKNKPILSTAGQVGVVDNRIPEVLGGVVAEREQNNEIRIPGSA